MKNPGKVLARTYGTKSPSRSEALRFIDSAKSPSTKKPCSGFFKFAFEIKSCWKTRSHVIFGKFFGTKRWITLEWKKISKIANSVLEKRKRRGSVPNFRTRALAVWKEKKIVKMNTEKRLVLCTTLYRKPMQPCNFDDIFYQLRHWFFHMVYTRRSVLKGTLRGDQKAISSNF